ncbi:MAG: hypothetical protein HY370_02935 [Proteobacteria bacterium]|nr:hypothetical protein [Pseudomonadota bacterium]
MPKIDRKKAFKLAAAGLALAGAIYGGNYLSDSVHDYRKYRGEYMTGADVIDYPVFLGFKIFGDVRNGGAYIAESIDRYGAWRKGEEYIDWENHIMFCVPPAISMDGWDNPEPGSLMETFKAKAIQQIKNVAFGRTMPGSMYRDGKPYKNRNIVIYIDELTYREFQRGQTIENHISVESHTGPGTNTSCGNQEGHMGGGYQSYAVSVSKKPEIIPVPK